MRNIGIQEIPETKECRICGLWIRYSPEHKYYINASKKGNRHTCVEDLQFRISKLEKAVSEIKQRL
jgi:hypothetical protein